jgi:3-oxoacyl-[acyl-carrier protein] reductase
MEGAFLGRIPAGRMGSKSDIGNAVLFLVGPSGSYVTGHVLVVDGGMWMSDATAVMSQAMEGGKL